MVIAMWGKNAASPVHALHFGFGVGAVLAPQIARPFLAERNVVSQNSAEFSTNISAVEDPVAYITSTPVTTKAPAPTDLPGLHSRIEIPYTISASLSFLFFLIFLGFYVKGCKRRN